MYQPQHLPDEPDSPPPLGPLPPTPTSVIMSMADPAMDPLTQMVSSPSASSEVSLGLDGGDAGGYGFDVSVEAMMDVTTW